MKHGKTETTEGAEFAETTPTVRRLRRIRWFLVLLLFSLTPAFADEAPWTDATLKIEPSVEFKFRTPRDGMSPKSGSTVRGNWLDVSGGKLPLQGVKGGPIKFEPRQNLVAIDLDGDGQLETSAKQDVFTVKAAYEGGTTGMYVFRLRRDYEKWFFQRACMAVGEIEKTPVAFVDDDNDGKFNGRGRDVVRVGGAVGAGYLGKLLPVKGKLYELEVDPSGTKLRYRPFGAPGQASPGTLDLFSGYKAKGKPAIAVVRRTDDELMLFDCAAKGGVPVPPGEYELVEAVMGPTRDQMALVTKGRMNPIVVKPGETTTVEWGCPGTFDFTATKAGNLLTVTLDSVKIYGKAGELYDKLEPVGMRIQVEVVDEATKKRVWFGPIDHCSGLRVPAQAGWLFRLLDDNVPYLGPFQSEWR